MSRYERETCAGCVFYTQDEDNWICHYEPDHPMFDHVAPWHVCENFEATVECRLTRALEDLAGCVACSTEGGFTFKIHKTE
jgi:hypothetical protein